MQVSRLRLAGVLKTAGPGDVIINHHVTQKTEVADSR